MEDAGGSSPQSRPPLTISVSKAPRKSGGGANAWPAAVAEEPVSPTARLMDGIYIVVTMGLGVPLNLAAFRAGIGSQLARYPRFQSIQVIKNDKPHWVLAPALNLEDHIIVVPTSPDAASDPDKAVEDYAASLSTAPMDPVHGTIKFGVEEGLSWLVTDGDLAIWRTADVTGEATAVLMSCFLATDGHQVRHGRKSRIHGFAVFAKVAHISGDLVVDLSERKRHLLLGW